LLYIIYYNYVFYDQELEKANLQNVEQRHQNEFFQWFEKYVRII